MSDDDVLFGFRLRLFSLAGEIGVRPACRAMGVHHSTYYRWKRRVDRWGLEAWRVRERRRPRMPTSWDRTSSSGSSPSRSPTPAGPLRISAELARERWGGRISPNGIWRVLRRHGLNTRTRRLSLVAGYAARYERKPPLPEPERHVEAQKPGELVGLDCFYVGRLSGTKGAVWQYTAIDVSSGFAWAELHASSRNPRAEHCSALARRVASELARAGWKLKALITDNGSEYRAHAFTDTLAALGRAAAHPRRPAPDQRTRRAPAADDPRGVLAAILRPLAGTQADRPRTRPEALPRLLQLRPRPHRPAHQRPNPRRDRLRCAQVRPR